MLRLFPPAERKGAFAAPSSPSLAHLDSSTAVPAGGRGRSGRARCGGKRWTWPSRRSQGRRARSAVPNCRTVYRAGVRCWESRRRASGRDKCCGGWQGGHTVGSTGGPGAPPAPRSVANSYLRLIPCPFREIESGKKTWRKGYTSPKRKRRLARPFCSLLPSLALRACEPRKPLNRRSACGGPRSPRRHSGPIRGRR
jgi:hypothetical protein